MANGPKGNGHKITVYNNEVYVLYLDSTYHVRLDKLNGGKWNNLFTSSECSNEVMIGEADTGVYFTYTNDTGDTVYAYKYLNGLKKLGDKVCYSTGYPANAIMSSLNGNTVVVYREAFNNNCLYVKKYDEKSNSWSMLLNGSMQANSAIIKQRGNLVYLLRNGTVVGDYKTYLYVYDMSQKASGWKQVGTNMVMDSAALEIDICFNGSLPYVVYSNGTDKTYAMTLKNNQWEQLGLKVSSQSATGVMSYYENEKLYVIYLDSLTGKVSIRSLKVEEEKEFPSVLEGWQEIDGRKYYYENGKRVYGGKKIDGYWYYFETDGVMKYNWWRDKNGERFYYDEQGHLVVNQGKKIDGWWYYFSTSGAMRRNWWRDKNGERFYYDEQGHLVVNQGKKINGWWYYFSTSGAMKYSWWRNKSGERFYYDEQGHLVVNQGKKINGYWYYFGTSGAMKYNWWRNKNGDKFYYNWSGHLVTGCTINISGIFYTFATSGKLI